MSGIAETYGFDWGTLWAHANNEAVRQSRDPNVLMAGDRVFIPDKRVKQESCAPTRRHTFQLKGIPCRLNLCLLDSQGKPRAGLKYKLTVDKKAFSGTTAADGLISEVVPPNADKAVLTVQVPVTGDETYTLDLAYLNPVEYASGVQARLKNLGLFKGTISGNFDEDTADAIRRFQQKAGMAVTGQADDATRQALKQGHGS